jgi:iron complex transport system substrate-binding protein
MKHSEMTLLGYSDRFSWLYVLLASLWFFAINAQGATTASHTPSADQANVGQTSTGQSSASQATNTERIVTIGGGITEIVFALGKGRSVVATDTSSYFPDRAKHLPKVGYQRSLAVEGLLAFEPTLILASAEAGPISVITQLQASGLKVEQLNEEPSLEGLLQRIKRIGHLVGEKQRANILSNDVQRAFAAIDSQKQLLKGEPPRVLFIMQHRGSAPMVAGKGTNIDTLIRLSGARNSASDINGFKTLSTEAMVALNPEIILTTSQTLEAMGGEAYLWRIPGLGRTIAGREQNLVDMDALLLMGFSIRSPVATKQLLSTWQAMNR